MPKHILALLTLASGSATPTEPDWHAIARADVVAAHELLVATHPAAHPAIGDDAFQRNLARAYSSALNRVRAVRDEGGYRAVLREFAVAQGDPHIGVYFREAPDRLEWTGLTFRFGADGFVVAEAESPASAALVGASLLDCDGVAARRLGASRLGRFRAVWRFGAEQVRAAPLLLIDENNPFVARPGFCRFRLSRGELRSVRLEWRPVALERVRQSLRANLARLGVARMDVAFDGGVATIGLRDMDATADPLIAEVARRRDEILAARAVVIDLRGNGGGSSGKGEALIRALFGNAAAGSNGEREGAYHWRASAFALATIEGYARSRADTYGETSDEVREWRSEADAVRAALASGVPFAPRLGSVSGVQRGRRAPASSFPELSRRVFVLTDFNCISSCLMLVDRLRAIGVRQIGTETNASRRYMEVREQLLPSGRAEFSTLQKVDLLAPAWFGPFAPHFGLPAAVDRPEAVEAWARSTALAQAGRR